MATKSDFPQLRLRAIETHVRSLAAAKAFWTEHFQLAPAQAHNFRIGDIEWRLVAGALPCGTRGPHGALPAFLVEELGQARAYLAEHGIPILFEEVLPGMSLLIFADPDGTPIELAQMTDVADWDIADRRLLRMRAYPQKQAPHVVELGPLTELTLYTHTVTESVAFYRDVLGLPVGFSVFGHIHLVMANAPLVLRVTDWRCKRPEQPHATEPVFGVGDLGLLANGLAAAGYTPYAASDQRISVVDPAGWRVHFESEWISSDP